MDAQLFMIRYGLKVCYEVKGIFFKHPENADTRARRTNSEIIVHELNAGFKKKKT